MEKLFQILESISERFKNPLLGSFLISWSIINYKIILVIFSGEKYEAKFTYIEDVLYSNQDASHWKLIYYPLIAAALYVFVVPAISLLSTLAGTAYDNAHNRVRIWVLKKATLTADQRDTLERELSDLTSKLQKEVQELKTTNLNSIRTSSQNAVKLFESYRDTVFMAIEFESKNWNANECVKAEHGKMISGPEDRTKFVHDVGIPKKWTEIIAIRDLEKGDVKDYAKRIALPEKETTEILLKLSGLYMMNIQWIDDTPYFQLNEGSWVALLNGRPE